MCRTPPVRLNVARNRAGRPAGYHPPPCRGCRFNGPNSLTQITRASAGGWSYRSRTRAIFAAKSGSLLAFHVLVARQPMPASRRIWRTDSVLMVIFLCSARYSTSLDRLHVVNGRPSSCGGVLATRQTVSRTGGPNLFGRPPLHFGSTAANPDSLNAWITSRAYCADAANISAASAALRP